MMCERILMLTVAAIASAQNYHRGGYDYYGHPRSFGGYYDGNRRFGGNQFGLERRDVRYRNDWSANRDRSFEQDYPYRPEYDTGYDNGYNNGFNPNGNVGQGDYGVQRRRSHSFEPENFDEQVFNSRNTENHYHRNVESKYRNVNFNLNSRIGTEGQNYNHQQTEYRSAVEKERSERNNDFFNEEKTGFKTYIRKESDGSNFDSEDIGSLARITNQNGRSSKSAPLIEPRVNNTDPNAENNENNHHDDHYHHDHHVHDNNNTKKLNNDDVKIKNISQAIPETTVNPIPNSDIGASQNTSNHNKESERNKKTDDMWVWGIEDGVNVTTTTTPKPPVTPDLDDRAAFDGGQCATGKIKVGNDCVEVD